MNNGSFKPENIRELLLWLKPQLEKLERLETLLEKYEDLNEKYLNLLVKVQTRQENLQKELSEHKRNHWKILSLLMALFSLAGTLIGFLIRIIIT